MKKHIKAILAPIILIATVAVFAWYLHGHPEIVDQLKRINPALLIVLVLLYCVTFTAVVAQLQISVLMYKKHMGIRDNFLLSAYSSLADFFWTGAEWSGRARDISEKTCGYAHQGLHFCNTVVLRMLCRN